MSFIEEEDIWNITEELMRKIFKEIKHVDLPEFVRIPYDECMERFGSDKPDMRFGMELCNVNDILRTQPLRFSQTY